MTQREANEICVLIDQKQYEINNIVSEYIESIEFERPIELPKDFWEIHLRIIGAMDDFKNQIYMKIDE